MKRKKSTYKNRDMSLEEYRNYVNNVRKTSSIWKTMLMHPTKEFLQVDNDYNRIQSYINLAYILSDVQETCFMDIKGVLRNYNLKFSHEAKRNFSELRKAIDKAMYCCKENQRKTKEAQESQDFIAGMSDVIYDTSRMFLDRLKDKKTVIHFFHLLRTIPNHNKIFTELDRGRYIFNN